MKVYIATLKRKKNVTKVSKYFTYVGIHKNDETYTKELVTEGIAKNYDKFLLARISVFQYFIGILLPYREVTEKGEMHE